MEMSSQTHRFTPCGKRRHTHWIGGWVGPISGLDAIAKRKSLIIVPAGNRTPAVQLVA